VKERQIEFDKVKEDEVNAAHDKFKEARRRVRKKGKTIPIGSLMSQRFELFGSDYIDRFRNTTYGGKQAEFYYMDGELGGTA
jgi:hypothetical protein